MRNIEAAYSRIMQRTERADRVEALGPCLICTYSVGSHGYTQAWDGVTVVLSHRIVWEVVNGPIPDGLTVDHECHQRDCVAIEHLRLLTNLANASDNGMEAFKTRPETNMMCRKGLHLMVMNPTGKPSCRECANERRRQRRAAARS